MIKKSILQRNLKKYKLNNKFLIQRLHLKYKRKLTSNLLAKFTVQKVFQILPKNSSLTRFNRFCFKTGRNHGYYRDFGLSRHVLREMAHNCELPGLTQSSW